MTRGKVILVGRTIPCGGSRAIEIRRCGWTRRGPNVQSPQWGRPAPHCELWLKFERARSACDCTYPFPECRRSNGDRPSLGGRDLAAVEENLFELIYHTSTSAQHEETMRWCG